ncbi:MAG: ATP-binding cassette domain-containing protein, partial [Bacillota bacterium]|nr:ATP-binding cassette domain-containing protein [Bacillota bacterium]
NIRLFGSLSVYDNILTACQKNITYSLLDGLFRTPKCRSQEKAMATYCEELLEAVGLIKYRDQQADNLPYGLQRRLEIARAMATSPELILLDEPAAGMNDEESMALTAFVQSIRDKYGITIVIIDHHMDVVMALCDRITVLNFGQLLANGSPDEIQNNPDVIEAYLGVDD